MIKKKKNFHVGMKVFLFFMIFSFFYKEGAPVSSTG